MRVYVKSYYAGLNSGGGEFVFKAGEAETEIPGFVMNVTGGVWKRVIGSEHTIYDAGGHPTKSATVNTAAINAVLGFLKNALIPNGTFNVLMSSINFVSNSSLIGGVNSVLVGPDPDTQGIADGTGQMFRIDNLNNVLVKQITIKNGYKGKGVWASASNNIVFEDLTIDGFSYGAWIGEDTISSVAKGCIGVKFIRPKVLNTRYWGLYFRCLNVTVDENKTQNISVIDPYFYNANMAAFVCAEGNVKDIVLENPRFERCNVCMHFESATDYTVINPRDHDTGKKPDHVPPNSEYPYTNWSMYHAFASRVKIIGGTLEKTCYHYAANGGGSNQIEYHGTTALDFVFEGGGTDTNKVFFQNYLFNGCTAMGSLIYQLAGADNFLRNFDVLNCRSMLGRNVDTGSGDGNLVAVFAPRTVNFRISNSKVFNSCLRITGYGNMIVTNNTFIGGTNNTQNKFNGVSGAQLSGSILDLSGNTFERAGGAVIGDSAFLIENFARVRTDNYMRTTCNYGYRYANNYRVEHGRGDVLGWTIGAYTQTGTTDFVIM